MTNEDFQQTVLDYFGIETQRHMDIMAQNSEVLAKIATLINAVDKMRADLEKALMDVSAAVPAGHAAVLDGLVGHLDDVEKKIVSVGEEMTARIGVIPVPGFGPSPGVAPAVPMAK